MQRQKLVVLYNNPASLYGEIAALCSLGLEESEIQYIIHKKAKEQARRKWENKDY